MDLNFDAKVISFNGFNPDAYAGTGTTGCDDPSFSKRILCEGDSWFSIGAIPSSNMLFPLRFAQSTLLVNLAQPGDTIKNMSDISSNPLLEKLIAGKNFLTEWDAIFISGGGNDLIDALNQIICTPSHGAGENFLDYIDSIALAALKKTVQDGYIKLAKLRDGTKNENLPIVTHLYDYPTPRDSKAKFLGMKVKGSWLFKELKADDVPEKFWISITDYLFEALGVIIMELTGKIKNFHVIGSTRNTLMRAKLGTKGEDGDWLNEIHPSAAGYKKLAVVISAEFKQILA